ncbi:MAG: amidase [Candidatus Latescibacteria bacterium]|nr:amidase [Candidatus Latescibacterota bacterium]
MDRDLTFATIQQLAHLIRSGTVSPVELTRHYLARIEHYNPRLNAYLAVTAERAQAAAQAAETAISGGHYLGPLHGVPLAIKDLVDLAGVPTTGGSLLFKDRVPSTDATVARRLAQAGAIFLGKTQMVEFAFGGVGINHHHGTPWNPWDLQTQRIPGGSSSGSGVAVAADLAPAALGSDTGGSVRIPSSFCGLVGLKPTFGRLSNVGVLPLDSQLDSVGPMCRSVDDAALLYQTMAGPDPASQPCDQVQDTMGDSIAGLRIGLPQQYFWEDVDPEVAEAVKQAAQHLTQLGAHVEEFSLPLLDEMNELKNRGSLTGVEAYVNFREHLENDFGRFDPIVAERMILGKDMTAADYFEINKGYADLQRRIGATFTRYDALMTPTTPFAAQPVDQVDRADEYFRINGLCLRNTIAVNLLGLCALSLPCGATAQGLPIGLQLIGRPWDEDGLLHLGRIYEQSTDWHSRRPALED